jgi:hypothetical protein
MAERYNILTRCLAAVALLFVYVASTSAILVGATTSPAQAYRGYGGRGYGYPSYGGYRGYGYRGRGYGYPSYGYGYVAPRCWFNRAGYRVCR